MKLERYIKEYAAAKLKAIKSNELMSDAAKSEKARLVEKALNLRTQGIITIDETMSLIADL